MQPNDGSSEINSTEEVFGSLIVGVLQSLDPASGWRGSSQSNSELCAILYRTDAAILSMRMTLA